MPAVERLPHYTDSVRSHASDSQGSAVEHRPPFECYSITPGRTDWVEMGRDNIRPLEDHRGNEATAKVKPAIGRGVTRVTGHGDNQQALAIRAECLCPSPPLCWGRAQFRARREVSIVTSAHRTESFSRFECCTLMRWIQVRAFSVAHWVNATGTTPR